MKILCKGESYTKDDIQIEKWNTDTMPYIVAVYPVALRSMAGQFSPKAGQRFRYAIEFCSLSEAEVCYTKLKYGAAKLKDYKDRLTNPNYIEAI